MSRKNEAAIERQQYTPKFIASVCGNCTHRIALLRLPAWMSSKPEQWPLEKHGIESSRCGIGGFQVKKLGSCAEHAFSGEDAAPNVLGNLEPTR